MKQRPTITIRALSRRGLFTENRLSDIPRQ